MIFIGVDVGIRGAICGYDNSNQHIDIIDMPFLKVKGGHEVDIVELARAMDSFCGRCRVALALVERAKTIPGKTALATALKAGRNEGVVLGVIASQFCPTESIEPATWKRAMACPKLKDGARQRASQLLPQHARFWARGKDDGRAESALLALYAERVFKKREMGL